MKNQRLGALIVEHFFFKFSAYQKLNPSILRRINLQIKHLEPHFFVINSL